MSPELREQIERLAEVALKKRLHWEGLGMRNIAGRSTEERIQMAKEYAIAEAEMNQAEADLKAVVSARL